MIKSRNIVILVLLFLLSACSVKYKDVENPSIFNKEDFINVGKLSDNWYDYAVVGHAFGGFDGKDDYTNTYDALVYNYNLGNRVFEIDLGVTSDDEIVLLHEWKQYHDIFKLGENDEWKQETLDYFKSHRIYDKYTTLTFSELLAIMTKIPDFYIVLDSKTFDVPTTEKMYSRIVDMVSKIDEKLLDRIVPQAYSPEIYDKILEIYPFRDVIFTLYSYYADSDGDRIYRAVKERKIKSVVMHMDNDWAIRVIRDVRDYARWDEEWNYSNMKIFIHTVNDLEKVKSIIEEEKFYGIYSDYIHEKDVQNIKQKIK